MRAVKRIDIGEDEIVSSTGTLLLVTGFLFPKEEGNGEREVLKTHSTHSIPSPIKPQEIETP